MDLKTEMPAVLNSVKEVTPHTGMYQMPVFHCRPNEETPFTYERFIYKERVPCCSMLFRVRK